MGYIILAQLEGLLAGIGAMAGFLWNVLADPFPHPLNYLPYWIAFAITIPIMMTAVLSLFLLQIVRRRTADLAITSLRWQIRILWILS